MSRVERLVELMKKNSLDSMFIMKLSNVRYVSGFTDEASYLLVTKNNNYFLTDGRFTEQAEKQCPEFKVLNWRNVGGSIGECVKVILTDWEKDIKNIGFEKDKVTFGLYEGIKNSNPKVEMVPTAGLVDGLRYVKDAEEKKFMIEAARIADKAFGEILNFVKPGMTENEVALQLEYFMRKEGAEGVSFDTILISGAKTSLLHGKPDDKVIENGEFLLIDFGALYNGYHSDMTRTIAIGEPDEKQTEVYNLVRKAEEEAVKTVKAGVKTDVPDSKAREILDKYIEYYYSGIGHGVGLELHEEPFISNVGNRIFEKDCIVTVEPGIYIPGWGGVRVEDSVIVTEDGCEIITHAPKDLIVIK
ncbi:M24 family metallopeptidase [Hathewaya massiliensis]|uniref:M24 family metallopeptidase n=1 Tax=Hathewaya massiliensis TaxID=1964382 RepID=UPI00115930B0|nr:Xaa-Pro peptidase family protein [Hathewaya massiliensis]